MDTCASRPGELVNTTGTKTRARIKPESWSTPRAHVHGPKSPGRAGRHCGPSDTSASYPGQLVDPTCPGTWTLAHVAQERLLTLQEVRPDPESPRRGGRPHEPLDQIMSRAGQLVDTSRTRTLVRVVRESWSTPRDLGHGPESPGTADRHRGPLETGPSRPGQLLDTKGPRTRALVTQDIYQPRGHSDLDPSRPGQLVESTGPQTLARVVQGSW